MNRLKGQTGRNVAAALTGVAAAVRRRIMPLLLAVLLLSGVGMALSGASANAEIARANASSTSTVSPDTSYVTLYFYDGNAYDYACTIGTAWSVGARVNEVLNGCSTRVWLHQYANNTGISWCTSPHSVSYPPYGVYFANLYISDNPAICPPQ
jgi:hypothetical protein